MLRGILTQIRHADSAAKDNSQAAAETERCGWSLRQAAQNFMHSKNEPHLELQNPKKIGPLQSQYRRGNECNELTNEVVFSLCVPERHQDYQNKNPSVWPCLTEPSTPC